MKELHSVIGAVALCLAGVGCKGERPPAAPPPTRTTSASMEIASMQNQVNELERERNDARSALAAERASSQQVEAVRRYHDELELRILDALDRADSGLKTLQGRLAKVGAKDRHGVDLELTNVEQQKAKLKADLRSLHGVMAKPWDEFRADAETNIKNLDDALTASRPQEQQKQ